MRLDVRPEIMTTRLSGKSFGRFDRRTKESVLTACSVLLDEDT